jgi:arylsulfatase A-like enzyme
MTRREFGISAAAPAVVRSRRPPNIVVLVADDHSVPYLGCYGDPHIQSPNLDRLAREGLRFQRAYVTAPQCSPSRASLFTGRTPHAIGCSRLHAPVRAETPSVLEPLHARGYFTGAFRKHHLGDDFQRRFDFYGDAKAPFESFFDKAGSRPFFLWMGFTDPHRPYRPGAIPKPHDPAKVRVPPFLPDTPEVRADLALHYDFIGRMDGDCGRVLDILEKRKLADNTIVFFFGDNGMPHPRAKATLYQPGVQVPMIVRWPGVTKPGTVTGDLVSTIDLPRTWLDAAGAPPLPAMEGRSLAALLAGQPYPKRQHIVTERNWHDTWDPQRSIVTQRHSLICNYRREVSYRGTLDHLTDHPLYGGPVWGYILKERKAGRLRPELESLFQAPRPLFELYDLEQDPDEFRNLAGQPGSAAIIEELGRAMSAWMEDTNDFLPAPFPKQGPDLPPDKLIDGYLA